MCYIQVQVLWSLAAVIADVIIPSGELYRHTHAHTCRPTVPPPPYNKCRYVHMQGPMRACA
jgi:hypothetical protein